MENKGISLIVLVITILIITILSASVIITVSGDNLFGKAKTAKEQKDLKELQEMVNVKISERENPVGNELEKACKLSDIGIVSEKYESDILVKNYKIVVKAGAADLIKEAARNSGIEILQTYESKSRIMTVESDTAANIANYRIYGNSVQAATPSTVSPVAITGLGENSNIKIVVCGKNLFNSFSSLTEFYTQPIMRNIREGGIVVNPGNWIFSNNEISIPSNVSVTRITVILANLKQSMKYTFSVRMSPSFTGRIYAFFGKSATYSPRYTHTFMTSDTGDALPNIPGSEGDKLLLNSEPQYITVPEGGIKIWDFQLEEGGSATEYEAYKGQTYVISLAGREPLRSVGDAADYIDYFEGKIIRNIGKIDYYNGENVGNSWMSTTGELTTGATVYYKLENPVEESIDGLPAISAFEGITHIGVSDGKNRIPSMIKIEY